MTSKYASNFKSYREQVAAQQNFSNSGNLNFIGVTKKSPKIYVQLMGNELFPVPIHQYVPVPQDDGSTKSSSFICRHFVGDDCYICNNVKDNNGNLVKPKAVHLAIVAQLENKTKTVDGRVTAYRIPAYEDAKVSQKKADELLEKFDADALNDAGIEMIEDGDNVVFTHIPRVGVLQANKTMDNYFALTLSETGSIDDRAFMIKRDGEGLNTKYSIMAVGDAPIDPDDIGLQLALSIHMTIDDYIDMFISESRYNRAFNLESNEEDSGDDQVDDSESQEDEDEEISMEEVMKRYRGASAKNRHEDA